MKLNINLNISKKTKKIEVVAIALISLLFILLFHKILITASDMFSHDSIWWYGAYHYFADSLSGGIFPYWDPYNSCGQPFYYNLGILRLQEPITIGFILLSKILHISILTIYHWEYMLRILFVGIGTYLCYRQTNKYLLTNLLVFLIFIFSSFATTCLRQNGVLYILFWVPWVVYFLLRLLKNINLYNMVGLSFFIGLSLCNYQGVYLLVYLFIILLTLLINQRKYLSSQIKNIKNLRLIIFGAIIIFILALPLLGVYIEQNKIVPITRLHSKSAITKGIEVEYSSVAASGTHSSPADFLELVFPLAAKGYFFGWDVSECFLYIGLFPFLLSIIGIFFSKEKYRINFLITLVTIGLLMLGPRGMIHSLFYFLFYPFRFARHMHLFSGFFIFTLMYFVGQGIDFIMEKFSRNTRAEHV
ncbi:MAG: hypothetical protein WC330_00600 [Candidatus Omnitrophota bacterium]|jgi:hypothetical protein